MEDIIKNKRQKNYSLKGSLKMKFHGTDSRLLPHRTACKCNAVFGVRLTTDPIKRGYKIKVDFPKILW